MELRDNENIIPENGDGLPVTQRLPQADAPPEPKTAPGLAEPLASAPESGGSVAEGAVPETAPAAETPVQEIPSAGAPVEPPRIQFHNAAPRGYAPAPGVGAGPYGYPGGPAGPYGYGGHPPKKPHRGRNIFLLILACVCALALGGGMMFCAIYTGVLSDAERFFRDTVREWYYGSPSEGLLPDDGPDVLPPDDGTGDLPPDNGTANVPDGSGGQPFVPIDGAPLLQIVTVEPEGENYREELSIPDIAELVKPSVVGVIKFVGENPQAGYTIGSGTIFTEDGYIITNEHVVSDPYSITVLLNDGTEYEATVVASDDDADIAILKIDAHGLTPAEFGNSAQLRVGEISVAIGCPASVDLQGTITSGIISALDRVITVDASGKTMRLLQTDAAINPGNSGGPLLNKYGQVIGINTVKMSSTTYEGLCFAIPTSELESIVTDLFTYGYVRGYPAIGITASSVLAAEDEYGGAPSGVLVASVDSSSGAHGKVEIGDIITHCNGTEVIAVAQINTIKNRLKVGDSVTLTVYRRGETFDVDVELVDQYDLTGE